MAGFKHVFQDESLILIGKTIGSDKTEEMGLTMIVSCTRHRMAAMINDFSSFKPSSNDIMPNSKKQMNTVNTRYA